MQEVSHSGIIRSVGPQKTVVEIISQSACAACHAQGICTAADAVKKQVEVPTEPGTAVGQEVEVVLRESMGMKAVLLSYVVPVLILLAVVVSLSYTGLHELWIGAAGLFGVGLWYLLLWLMRGRFAHEYVFTLKRK